MTEALTPLEAIETIDQRGRKLTIKKLDILKELDLIEGAGKNAENSRWMMLATLAACVTHIDGVPYPTPTSRIEIRARVVMVGSDGIDAVTAAFGEKAPTEDEPETTVAQAKN